MNTKELRDIVIGELNDMNDGKTTKEKASAVARLAGAAIAAKKLELQVARFRIETGTTEVAVDL